MAILILGAQKPRYQKYFPSRYADENHLTREWSEMTRHLKNIDATAPRASTYVNKLKVSHVLIDLSSYILVTLIST